MTSSRHQPRYSLGEEIANSLTHGIGAALSIAGLAILVTSSAMLGDPWRVVSFSIYGACLVMLYLASTFYHALPSPRAKKIFRAFDHSAIFLLIAGTYTPVSLVALRGGWGWTLFGLIWGLAVGGIVLELCFMDRFRWLTLTIYIGMGWLAIIATKPLIAALPVGALFWLALGGLLYTGGVGFYVARRLPYHHAIWHLFVLGGSACHFFAFLFHFLPGTSP